MCYEPGARPPRPPVSGGAGPGRQLKLLAEDGNEFIAFSALSERPTHVGVVILPDVRGLHGFYEELALRFTEAGANATAIDYFGRTAGAAARDDDFEFMPHVLETRPDTLQLDINAAVNHLRSDDGGSSSHVFTVGFCFGGRLSFNQSAQEQLRLAGVIGFYGRVAPRDRSDSQAPLDFLQRYRVPLLGLFGGDDPGIPREDVERFRLELDRAGLDNEVVIYDDAPHSFFDRAHKQFASQSDDAWARMLRFIKAHSSG